ncbi:amidohydrolase family protein [Luteimonas aestuarii]|uniref:Amidohydrolase family protein n=1 Tax=Luteimonas aestuarii TaxID=453837 RepID=A0A4R5TKF4_9GAMM|nr:amidohydrolase family protein [Luteimonas aestuarii]TDK22482.1 amidohydrolase family protein [Luteimonas aestuarii]
MSAVSGRASHPLLFAALFWLVGCTQPSAQQGDEAAAQAASPEPDAGVVLIEGACVFDGERDLGIVSMLLRDGRIEAIGPDVESVPEDARRVDYSGRYLVPGLVSNHAHVANTEGTEHGDRFYTRGNVIRDLRRFQALGVTTVTALGLNGDVFHALRDEVNADPSLGASLLGAGGGIGVADGAPPATNMGLEHDPALRPATPDEAREAVRRQAEAGIDIVKLWVDDLGGEAPIMRPDIYRAAIEEAHALGLLVAAHIHDLGPAKDLVDAGIDVIAHGVRDRPVDAALVAAMRGRGTWYMPTVQIDEANYLYAEQPGLIEQEPALRAALPQAVRAQFEEAGWRAQQLAGDGIAKAKAAVQTNLANLRTLHEAGVRIGFGTDSGALPHRVIGFAEHRELELMTQAGFTPRQALTTATRDAATLLGLDDRGTLAPGKRADFVVLGADPLSDIRNTRRIEAVWQAGRQVSGAIGDVAVD